VTRTVCRAGPCVRATVHSKSGPPTSGDPTFNYIVPAKMHGRHGHKYHREKRTRPILLRQGSREDRHKPAAPNIGLHRPGQGSLIEPMGPSDRRSAPTDSSRLKQPGQHPGAFKAMLVPARSRGCCRACVKRMNAATAAAATVHTARCGSGANRAGRPVSTPRRPQVEPSPT